MTRREVLTALPLVLALAGVPLAIGCQQQVAVSNRPAEAGATTKQVTIAVTGMT